MPETPEAQARKEINRLLRAVAWHVCSVKEANNLAIPIETFDIIITDEARRSIYNPWRQVRREKPDEESVCEFRQLDRGVHRAKCV